MRKNVVILAEEKKTVETNKMFIKITHQPSEIRLFDNRN